MFYFIYSKKQHDLLYETNKSAGLEYTPGKVNVQGYYRLFTEIRNTPDSIHSDFKIVYFTEDLDSVIYMNSSTFSKERRDPYER